MTKRIHQYWPLLALPVFAIATHYVLVQLGKPWSPTEWASNIVFAYAITLATVVLSRRQSTLQESIADTELFGKHAAISGAIDRFVKTCSISTAQQILIDARAGLHLLPYADLDARRDYLETLNDAIGRLQDVIDGSTRPYTFWTEGQWLALSRLAVNLHKTLQSRVRKQVDRSSQPFATLQARLSTIAQLDHSDQEVPFKPFERSYRYGDVSGRIRVLLDWQLLQGYMSHHQAKISIYRHWAPHWLDNLDAHSVWYITNDSSFTNYRDPNSRPISFREVNHFYDLLPEEYRTTIESMSTWLKVRQDGTLPTTEIVTMEIAEGRVIVLDGNHRLAAIFRRRPTWPIPLQVSLVEYRISAPRNENLLPDLRFHRTNEVHSDHT